MATTVVELVQSSVCLLAKEYFTFLDESWPLMTRGCEGGQGTRWGGASVRILPTEFTGFFFFFLRVGRVVFQRLQCQHISYFETELDSQALVTVHICRFA